MDHQAGSLTRDATERTFLSQRILHLQTARGQRSRHLMRRDAGGEGATGAHLLHSAQESSPRERFIWTSSGGMDFRIEEPLESEPDRMAVGWRRGEAEGWRGEWSEWVGECMGDFIGML